MRKSLTVGIIGPTNAGKSTLINYLIGEKVSIVTHKVQTTRSQIRGILNIEDTQIIFIDTPGIFIPKRLMESTMVRAAWSALAGVDLVMVVLDSSKGFTNTMKTILKKIKDYKSILVLNKIDIVDKPKLLPLAAVINAECNFDNTFMISALKSDGLDDLKSYLIKSSLEGDWFYEDDLITDAPLSFLAAEITREKLMLRVHKEIPYSVVVETELFEEIGDKYVFHQIIYVTKESYKKIILGKEGAVIQHIRISAVNEMQKVFSRKIKLFLFVKVRSNWYNDPHVRSNISY